MSFCSYTFFFALCWRFARSLVGSCSLSDPSLLLPLCSLSLLFIRFSSLLRALCLPFAILSCSLLLCFFARCYSLFAQDSLRFRSLFLPRSLSLSRFFVMHWSPLYQSVRTWSSSYVFLCVKRGPSEMTSTSRIARGRPKG